MTLKASHLCVALLAISAVAGLASATKRDRHDDDDWRKTSAWTSGKDWGKDWSRKWGKDWSSPACNIPSVCPRITGPQTLPLPFDGYMPAIDNETMFLHSQRHHASAIAATNAILDRYPKLRDENSLTNILVKLGTKSFTNKYRLLANDTTALRNQAGSTWNHALFWRIMTTYGSSDPAAELSPELLGKITSTWGSVADMTAALKRAADGVFGSGWAWLVVRDNLKLAIVTTPNQDNPLMTSFVPAEARGWPLLGIDVWEHSYYLKYRQVRGGYTTEWPNLIDYKIMQRNYDLIKDGTFDGTYC